MSTTLKTDSPTCESVFTLAATLPVAGYVVSPVTSMPRVAVDLKSVQQTLLITLYAKAMESRREDSVLHDHFADQLVQRIDFDFVSLHIHCDQQVSLACRAREMDQRVQRFLDEHDDAVILDLGCGLDTRYDRLGRPACKWVNVDYPHVIALRQRLQPPHGDVMDLASSLTQTQWLADLPRDRPTLVVAEGVLPYLDGSELDQLLTAMSAHFHSAEMVFDAYNRAGTWLLGFDASIRATGATLRSSLRDLRPHVRLNHLRRHAMYQTRDLGHFSRLSRSLIRCMQAIPLLGSIAALYECWL